MKTENIKMLRLLQCEDHNIFHFTTTCEGGFSKGNYASFNLGEYVEDDPSDVKHNRELLCELLGIKTDNLAVPLQVHGSSIVDIDDSFPCLTDVEKQELLNGKDALVTACPGICIGVTTADCVPVLLYDPKKKVTAAIHAGWRGTVQNITGKTVRYMHEIYGCEPADLHAGIGPSICIDAFEVGPEVVDAFRSSGFPMEQICMVHPETGKSHIDLWKANRMLLLDAGIPSGSIAVSAVCTYHNQDQFFSARRLGIRSGRLLTGVLIKRN